MCCRLRWRNLAGSILPLFFLVSQKWNLSSPASYKYENEGKQEQRHKKHHWSQQCMNEGWERESPVQSNQSGRVDQLSPFGLDILLCFIILLDWSWQPGKHHLSLSYSISRSLFSCFLFLLLLSIHRFAGRVKSTGRRGGEKVWEPSGKISSEIRILILIRSDIARIIELLSARNWSREIGLWRLCTGRNVLEMLLSNFLLRRNSPIGLLFGWRR